MRKKILIFVASSGILAQTIQIPVQAKVIVRTTERGEEEEKDVNDVVNQSDSLDSVLTGSESISVFDESLPFILV